MSAKRVSALQKGSGLIPGGSHHGFFEEPKSTGKGRRKGSDEFLGTFAYKPKPKRTKVLTSTRRKRIMNLVQKIKRKVEMNKNITGSATKTLKSIAWLVEAAFRGFIGWVLLSNFDHIVTTVAAFYALGTGALIVVFHFIKANR